MKNKWVHVKCSENEHLEMKAKAEAAGMPLSDLIRRSLERTNVWTARDRNAVYELCKELSRIGNNLNQVAKWANTEKGALEAVQIISALQKIEEEIKSIKEGLDAY